MVYSAVLIICHPINFSLTHCLTLENAKTKDECLIYSNRCIANAGDYTLGIPS